MRSTLASACLITFVATTSAAAQQATTKESVAGKWSLVVKTAEGVQPRTLELSVAQDSVVTGTLGSPMGSLPISMGRLSGDRLQLHFEMNGNAPIRVLYDVAVTQDTLRGVFRQGEYEGAVLGVRGSRAVAFPQPGGDSVGLALGRHDELP